MTQRTALYNEHLRAGAKLVPFAGWDMPLHYGSQVQEHHAVRRACGVFDVSHMTIIEVTGPGALAFLRGVLANDPARLEQPGAAAYGLMLNAEGGIIDDLITYRRFPASGAADALPASFRLVTNAGTHDNVMAWLGAQQAQFLQQQDLAVTVSERDDLSMLAIQGPTAQNTFAGITSIDAAELNSFEFIERDDWMIARTGYTGEDGVEVMLPHAAAVTLWQQLLAADVAPAGLGARDTLRCEAGLNLYGQDMDDSVNPLVSNLAWTIAWDPQEREFVGRNALAAIKAAGVTEKLTGLVLLGRGVVRHGYPVQTNAGEGVITSGIFSPTLGYSIALARLPKAAKGEVTVAIRGKAVAAKLRRPPFVKHGEDLVKLTDD